MNEEPTAPMRENLQVQMTQIVTHLGVLPRVVEEMGQPAPSFVSPDTGVVNTFMLTPTAFLELAFSMMMVAPTEMLTPEARAELTKKLSGGVVLPTGSEVAAAREMRR